MTVGLSLGADRWRLIRRGDPIQQWFADTGRQGLYINAQRDDAVWQDAARTQPAAVGEPVGGLTDLSGNGHHGTQARAAEKMLRIADGLDSDGVDDRIYFGTALPAALGAQSFSVLTLAEVRSDDTEFFVDCRGFGGVGTAPGWQIRTSSSAPAFAIFDSGDLATSIPNSDIFPVQAGYLVRTMVLDRSAATLVGRTNGNTDYSYDVGTNLGNFAPPTGKELALSEGDRFTGTTKALVILAGTDYQPVEQALLEMML